MEERIAYYKRMGAPGDQNMLIALLKEVQAEENGIAPHVVFAISEKLDVKESVLLALIRRIPSLRLSDTHVLQMCAGPNCGKHIALAAFAEKNMPKNVRIEYVSCMRLCGKGPNVKFDGKLYHKADESLLRRLVQGER